MLRIYLVFSCILLATGCERPKTPNNEENPLPVLSGPYLGQTPPGNEAQIFAPGFISTAMFTRDIAMTPDGNEIYFCISTMGLNLIFFTKQVNGIWTEPAVAPFISDYHSMYYEPHITSDGRRMLFLSNKPISEDAEPNEDIWVVERAGDQWGTPYNLGTPVCTAHEEYFPSVTKNGTLYFSRQLKNERINYIYRSRLVNGNYQEPERLGPEVNCGNNRYNAFVDPDEKFIIVPALGMPDSYGGTDYYIVFRHADDTWEQPINMGEKVNSANGREYSPYISPDGNYFFFMSAKSSPAFASNRPKFSYRDLIARQCEPQNGNSDIYWISTSFFNELKSK